MNPPGAGTKSSCRPPAAFSTYRTFCSAMSRSDSHGVTTASVIMPTSRMPCPVSAPTRLKNPSSRLPRNTSPVMCLVGGIHFSGASGNSSRASSACASSSRNDSGRSGLISNAWPSPSCQSGQPGLVREELVEQLRHRHRVRRLDRVGGGEVVVLAGVDDDAGAGVHLPGEPLVDERADRVDVAEQDAVHRVVEHHVQPLQPGQRGDLRHAQPGRVVGQPHVPAAAPSTTRPAPPASAGSSPAWRTCRRSPPGSRPPARSPAATARSSGSPRSRRRRPGPPPAPAGCPRRCRRSPRSGRSTAAAAGRRTA